MRPPRREIVAIDALRGVAAFLVVLGHTRSIFFTAQGLPVQGEGWQRIALIPTGLAEEAVAVFFVISGYLVGGSVIERLRNGSFTWRDYAARRLSRMYVVLVPGLIFTIMVDAALRHLGGYSALGVPSEIEPATLFCNLAFLQESRCEPFGSNSSLWSLSYEFWFYVIFAAGAVAVAAIRKRPVIAIINFAVVAGVLVLFGFPLLYLLPAWIMGVVLAWAQRFTTATAATPVAIWGSVVLLAAAAIGVNLVRVPEALAFIIVGAATLPLLHVMTLSARVWTRAPSRGAAWVGRWSFSLYVFHRPIAVALLGTLGALQFQSPAAQVAIIYLSALVVSALAFPCYFLGEKWTPQIRNILLPRSRSTAAARS